MLFMNPISYVLSRFAAKMLAIDNTAVPRDQMKALSEMLARHSVALEGEEANDLLACLKRKHLLNSITVRKMDNGLVFSSEGNGNAESKRAADVIDYIGRNLSRADVAVLRLDREWMMLMPHGKNLYIVRANSGLSTVELRALAREIELVLGKRVCS